MSDSAAVDAVPDRPKHCLDCGAPLRGPYCSACGQPAIVRAVSLREVISNFAEDVFEFDSRLWRTLLPLMFRPGSMTSEYLAGRRARFLAPLRLYLLLSVVFFVLAAISGYGLNLMADPNELAQIDTRTLDPEIATRVEDAIQRRTDRAQGRVPDVSACENIQLSGNFRGLAHLRDRFVRACEIVSADSGESLEAAAVDNIPVMMVVLIPLLALIMKILYPLSRRYYVEHLLFFVHFHAFGFLLLSLLIIAQALGSTADWLATPTRAIMAAGFVYLPVYLYIAMHKVYGQSHLVTGLKYGLLCAGYLSCLGLSLSGTIVYTALTL